MEHWYIYYECPKGTTQDTIERARLMQAALAANGPIGRLVQRIGTGDRTTLMEIYEHVEQPERFEAALADALAASGLGSDVQNGRHLERFRDI
ncbi:MAG: DUF4936 family protein [Burkholderiaceae bacterium]